MRAARPVLISYVFSVYIYIYICINVCMYVCMYICIYIYTYMYTYCMCMYLVKGGQVRDLEGAKQRGV